LLEGAAPPAPSPVVTPPVPGARDAAVARAAAAAPQRGTVVVNGAPRGAGAPPPKPKPKPKAPKPKPKARPKKRVKRESPPPEPVEEAEPLPPAPADNEVQEGAALAPRAFREKPCGNQPVRRVPRHRAGVASMNAP
jgi:translation initiation factor IF-2